MPIPASASTEKDRDIGKTNFTLNFNFDNFGTPKFLPKAPLTCEYAFFACAKQMSELHDYLCIFACLPHCIHIHVLFNHAS